MTRSLTFTYATLTAALVFSAVLCLAVGAVRIPVAVIINTLFDLDGQQQDFIINASRLPRMLLSLMTGAALAVSGVIIQALLRNPLASPKIIGINSGAALAVLIAAIFAPDLALSWTPLIAVLGGIASVSLVYAMAEFRPISPARLALIGIAVGFTCDAGVDFILVTADTYDISAPMVWMTGSLWGRGWQHVAVVWPLLTGLVCVAVFLSFRLDLIRLGTAQAASLGMNVRIERAGLLLLATLLAAISVSMVGVLGFVGLMSPHIARALVGGTNKRLLPAAMLIGATLVMFADALGRSILPPIEVSAGVITALLGAPFFIYLLVTRRTDGDE
ncbi:MAG: iron ABC transporter permease [Pseudomonadota bacterium]